MEQLKKLLLSKDNAWEAATFVGCTRASKKDHQHSQRLVHVALLFPFEVENDKGVLLLDAGLRFCEVVQLSNLAPNNSTTTNKQKFQVFLQENDLIVESSSFVYVFTLKSLCFQGSYTNNPQRCLCKSKSISIFGTNWLWVYKFLNVSCVNNKVIVLNLIFVKRNFIQAHLIQRIWRLFLQKRSKKMTAVIPGSWIFAKKKKKANQRQKERIDLL